jgi:cytidylate kinase
VTSPAERVDLRALLAARRPRNGAYRTVVVDGRGASGKTTLADLLAPVLAGFDVVHGDDWFEPHQHEITWGDFNESRFDAELLAPLRAGERSITLRAWDFPAGGLAAPRQLSVDRGVLVERWFGFGLPVPWDLRIWVETPAAVCLERGLGRDGGVALGERAVTAWTQVWQPREQRYIDTTDPVTSADLVLDGTTPFADQLVL